MNKQRRRGHHSQHRGKYEGETKIPSLEEMAEWVLYDLRINIFSIRKSKSQDPEDLLKIIKRGTGHRGSDESLRKYMNNLNVEALEFLDQIDERVREKLVTLLLGAYGQQVADIAMAKLRQYRDQQKE